MNPYIHRSLLLTLGIIIIVSNSAIAAEESWNVLVDSTFDKSDNMVGWTPDKSEPEAKIVNGALEIPTRSGENANWADNYTTYKNRFLLAEATVKIEVDVVSQTPGRDFGMILLQENGNRYYEPAVWINFCHGEGNGEVLIRRYEEGKHKTILKENLPFKLDGLYRVSLTLTNGSGVLNVTREKQSREFTLLDLVGKKWVIHPFTIKIGAAQHGNPSEPAVVRITRIRVATTKQDEAGAKELEGNGPGKSEKVRYLYLDAVANRHFKDDNPSDNTGGWTDQGANDLRFIPRGYQYFRNVPFNIVDKLEEVGNAYRPGCVSLRSTNTPDMPLESKPIAVNAKAPWLYFLQAAAWASPYGAHCADYVVTYSDGSTAVIPLRVGKEIGEWWNPKDLENALVAWDGQNPMFPHVGFYLYEWKNPHPDKTVENLVFKSRDTGVAPMLIAITAAEEKIAVGPEPRRFRKPAYTICEYRQRPKTSLYWQKGPAEVTVKRRLPIAENSDVKHARIDVIRYRAETPATVMCVINGVTMKKQLPAGELKAQFLVEDQKLLDYFTKHKESYDITVKLSGENGLGTFVYESNPNEHYIPGGEDVVDKTYAVTGVFQVTGFLPVHRFSGYVEYKPNPMGKPKAAETAAEEFHPAKEQPDLLFGDLCLNSIWQWQPGPMGLEVEAGDIPSEGWKDIAVPANVKTELYLLGEEGKKDYISAWFRKTLHCPKEWDGKRLILHFDSVADFATVYCNGKKILHHEGLLPFDVDLSGHLRLGESNTIQLFCQNVYKGIVPVERILHFTNPKFMQYVSKYKGHAYRVTMDPSMPAHRPDEIRLYLDGKNIAQKSSVEDVIDKGDGRYHRTAGGMDSLVNFSTPGNAPLEELGDRFTLGWMAPGAMKHFGRGDGNNSWRYNRPRDCGPWKDVTLRILNQAHISDVFVKPSVRKMRLDADVTVANVPADGAVILARVRDGASTVLQFDSTKIDKNSKIVTLTKSWNNPILWGPYNPHLYYLELILKDQKTGKIVDRKFIRFGFREFWIEGPYFVFNGQKPYYIQGNSVWAGHLPTHRFHFRWQCADANQQANMNMLRLHKGGYFFPETLDVADEMGMLMMQETNFQSIHRNPGTYDLDHPIRTEGEYAIPEMIEQAKTQLNHPSLVIWSTENEHGVIHEHDEVTPKVRRRAELLMNLNAAFKKMDPTRSTVNNGGHIFLFTDYYKDPRVDILDGHYVQPRLFDGWKKKYQKPCTMGEISMGGPFGWTYQGEVRSRRDRGEDPQPYFWDAVNAATRYLGGRLHAFRSQELSGLWPFGAMKTYHPFLSVWEGVDYRNDTPPIPWPAQSGLDAKEKNLSYGREIYNFYDPAVPRCVYLRTYDPLKDVQREVTKLEPRFSPEVIVQVLGADGKPVKNTAVWLTPTDQPTNPFGVVTDNDGKAWFWCKSGAGEYFTWVQHAGRWYNATLTPAPAGEWMQVKTVVIRLPQTKDEH
ncbi:MAG: hypothetical protein JXA11_11370 [Phycisphaerae bacterium]|nr:hypothetical protein [Phycisphaerae bacterium]